MQTNFAFCAPPRPPSTLPSPHKKILICHLVTYHAIISVWHNVLSVLPKYCRKGVEKTGMPAMPVLKHLLKSILISISLCQALKP